MKTSRCALCRAFVECRCTRSIRTRAFDSLWFPNSFRLLMVGLLISGNLLVNFYWLIHKLIHGARRLANRARGLTSERHWELRVGCAQFMNIRSVSMRFPDLIASQCNDCFSERCSNTGPTEKYRGNEAYWLDWNRQRAEDYRHEKIDTFKQKSLQIRPKTMLV